MKKSDYDLSFMIFQTPDSSYQLILFNPHFNGMDVYHLVFIHCLKNLQESFRQISLIFTPHI